MQNKYLVVIEDKPLVKDTIFQVMDTIIKLGAKWYVLRNIFTGQITEEPVLFIKHWTKELR